MPRCQAPGHVLQARGWVATGKRGRDRRYWTSPRAWHRVMWHPVMAARAPSLVGPAGSRPRAQPLAGRLLEQVDRDDRVRPEVALGKERPCGLALGRSDLLDDFLGAGGGFGRGPERADLQNVSLAQADENDVYRSRCRLGLRAHGL